jgi:type I restriction enzyme S subunit
MRIDLPPLDQQRAIADYLDGETARIDALISIYQRLGVEIAERTTAQASAVFDGPPVRLKRLVTKIGSGKTPSGGSEVYQETGVALVRSMNVRAGRVDRTDLARIDPAVNAAMASTQLKEGDVLLNITGGSIGRTAVVDVDVLPANVNQHVCILRPRAGVPASLLSAALMAPSPQSQIASCQVGGNRDGLTFEQVGDLVIAWPTIGTTSKSNNVERLLEHGERFEAVVTRQIDLLLERRKALITAAVTGQLEIHGVAA